MITRIEALNFRCLRYVSQPISPFNVLVGPNASGKTTFLDVVAFLSHLVSDGLDAALDERTQNFVDLVWGRREGSFELAIELAIPEKLRTELEDPRHDTVRYEIAVGIDPKNGDVRIRAETVLLKTTPPPTPVQRDLFPQSGAVPETLLTRSKLSATREVIKKFINGTDTFYPETKPKSKDEWVPTFRLGPRRSALANLPEDEYQFPVATWLKLLLANNVQQLVLNSLLIRKASPPGKKRRFEPDGSNLPWMVAELESRHPKRLHEWIAHLRTALPDLEGLRTIEREDDRHRYLMLRYRGGLEVPSWMASDGTLRLLALTLPAYLPDITGVYLIEEPENGIHPQAIETMYQSISSVYDAQVLLATHSPVLLSLVEQRDLLSFAKDREGATDTVLGSDHPALREWRGETNLSVLFAAGVLD